MHALGIINLKVLAWLARWFNLPLTGMDEFDNLTFAFSRFNIMSPLILYFLCFLPLIMALLVVLITCQIRYVVLEYNHTNIYDSHSYVNLNTNWSFPCFTQIVSLTIQQFDFFHYSGKQTSQKTN